MLNAKSIFKGVIKSAILVLVLIGMSNCNQFASFTGSETDAHLSQNPVFEDPQGNSFVGNDPLDDGLTPNNGDDIPITDEDIIPTEDPTPEVPEQPDVVIDRPTPLPPFRFCPNNDRRFQFLKPNGEYTDCRVCETRGFKDVDGVRTPVCWVQICEETKPEQQYIFFKKKQDQPLERCTPCAVLNKNKTKCLKVLTPPDKEPPPPPVIDRPQPTDDDDDDSPRTPITPTATTGGDGGGDGGGDPLMLDTVGVEYANADTLRNSEDSYFKSGELNLTSQEEGTRFNLLGKQHQTRLDDRRFLHINEKGKDFKYQISWIQSHQTRYQFLALPDEDGNVLGIDQLFGDNTFGPDTHRPFATDGFQALEKWDRGDAGVYARTSDASHYADGYIDLNDRVWSKLRVWHDYNGDGNVDSPEERKKELSTLSAKGITYIHLMKNAKFFETDPHGNDIAYKSIVGFRPTHDGGLKLGTAFDMWFQYNPKEILEIDGGKIKKCPNDYSRLSKSEVDRIRVECGVN